LVSSVYASFFSSSIVSNRAVPNVSTSFFSSTYAGSGKAVTAVSTSFAGSDRVILGAFLAFGLIIEENGFERVKGLAVVFFERSITYFSLDFSYSSNCLD
jgi:hypothetical protein